MDDAPRSPSSLRSFRDLHRKTWELELLISGAVLFVLLQLPGPVDAWFHRLQPTLAEGAELGAFLLYYYLKLIVYTLVIGLVLHLALRAYWVGLVGLNSVFPTGVLWDRLSMGPRQLAVVRRRAPSLRSMIRVTDALASVVFGAAFALVWVFLISVAVMGVAVAAALALSALFFDGERLDQMFWVMIALLFIPTGGVAMLDRALGDRLAPDGRAARGLERALAFAYHATLQPFYLPINNVLYSHLGRRTYVGATWTAMFVVAGLFLVRDIMIAGDALRFGGGGLVPDRGGAQAVLAAHYDDRRADPWSQPRLPSIPSEIVRGRWLPLFVPYHPERDAAAVAETCPELEPLAPTGIRLDPGPTETPPDERLRRALACLGGLWDVTLDGAPPAALEWRFATRPGTELPGIVAFLPLSGVAPGAHLITLDWAGPTDDDEPPEEDELAHLRHHIPFWY